MLLPHYCHVICHSIAIRASLKTCVRPPVVGPRQNACVDARAWAARLSLEAHDAVEVDDAKRHSAGSRTMPCVDARAWAARLSHEARDAVEVDDAKKSWTGAQRIDDAVPAACPDVKCRTEVHREPAHAEVRHPWRAGQHATFIATSRPPSTVRSRAALSPCELRSPALHRCLTAPPAAFASTGTHMRLQQSSPCNLRTSQRTLGGKRGRMARPA